MTTVDITRPSLKTVVAAATILLLLTGSKVFSLYNVFFSPFPSVFAVLIAYTVGLIYGRSGSGSRKKVLERLFGHRISRSVFSQLVNGYEPSASPVP